jgi:uncharacterized protein YndB with AHSA1/START domain
MGAPLADDSITVTRHLETEARPEELWEAVVDDEARSAWWGGETRLDPTPGGGGYATDPDGTLRTIVVDEVHDGDGEDGRRRLALRWWPEAGGPTSTVELVVEPRPGGSRLTVTERRAAPTATLCAGRLLDLDLVLLLAAHQRCVGAVGA